MNQNAQQCLGAIQANLSVLSSVSAFITACRGVDVERVIELAFASTTFTDDTHKRQHSEMLMQNFRHCLDWQRKVEMAHKELDGIRHDVVADMRSESPKISPRFYALTDRLLAPTHGEKENQIINDAASGALFDMQGDNPKKIVDALPLFNNYCSRIIPSMKNIRLFGKIKEIDSNIVMVGANGSGKSTLSREMSAALGITMSAIPAKKTFKYQPPNQDTMPWISNRDGIDNAHRSHSAGDLTYYINYLITEDLKDLERLDAGHQRQDGNKPQSLLRRVCNLWGEIISHRTLKRITHDNKITVFAPKDGQEVEYAFSQMSDGEKAVFFNIAFVLLAPQGDYIIVDEPENHLNLAIVNQLWDMLESERPDAQFVYLTHNPDFVAGRRNAQVLWIKNVVPKSGEWEYEKLPDCDGLDEQLIVKLVGERRKILFCEGADKSLDSRLYRILFPKFTVMPAGGKDAVKNYTRAFNKNNAVFKNAAIGIIDGDFLTDAEAEQLREKHLYALRLPAVENLLHDEELLQAAAERFCAPEKVCAARTCLLNLSQKNQTKQAANYASEMALKQLNKMTPPSGNSLAEVLEGWRPLSQPHDVEIQKNFHKRFKEIAGAIEAQDYGKMLELYHCKSIMEVGKRIVNNYVGRVLSLLNEDEGLRRRMVEKYFPDVPAE